MECSMMRHSGELTTNALTGITGWQRCGEIEEGREMQGEVALEQSLEEDQHRRSRIQGFGTGEERRTAQA